MFEFDTKNGTLNLAAIGSAKGIVRFNFDRCSWDSDWLSWKKRGSNFVAVCEDLELSVSIDQSGFSAKATNTGSRPTRLMSVAIEFHPSRFLQPPLAEDYLEYINSFNFETLSGVKRVGLPNRWLKANPTSSMVYVIHHRKTKHAWLFSTLPPHAGDLVSFRALHDAQHLEGNFGLEIKCVLECLMEPGKSSATSKIQFRSGDNSLGLLMELGVQWQEGLGKPVKPAGVGWNSWDYFAEAVCSEDILENARASRKLLGIAKPDIVVDGGWDERWGRWEPCNLFPEGMEKLAAEIKREGGIPGIWIAPTAVNVYTRLYRDHGDWFMRDRSGKILEESYGHGQTVQLDITVPEVQSLIHQTFARLHGYGFRLFKVDFTQHVTLSGGFCRDGTVPRGGVLRKLFEIIRDAIGPESYLFTCGAPFETVTGLADSVRTSGDIHNHWSHVLLNLTNISARWWMSGRLWNNDPDFLIVRTPENSPGVPLNRPMNPKPIDYTQLWRTGREFNDREARTYAMLVLLAGAELMMGDHLPALREAGLDLLRRVLNGRLTQAAVPLDLFDSHEGLPSLWLADEKDHWLVGLFNWEEDAREIELDVAAHGITAGKTMRSFWDDRPMQSENGIIRVRLEPRDCMGIHIDKRS